MSLTLTDGSEASARQILAAFEEIRATGQSVLDQLYETRAVSLHQFEQQIAALNLLRQRLANAPVVNQAASFHLIDLSQVDQSQTNATVLCGAGVATLQQKQETPAVTVESTAFSTSAGIYQQIGSLYQVYSAAGAAPTGTLSITLSEIVDLSSVVFSLTAPPGTTGIQVLASANGISYTPAQQVAFAGKRVYASFAPVQARFLQILCPASLPDTTGGSTYTFGVSALTPYFTSFYLESQLVSKPLPLQITSSALKVLFTAQTGVAVYLSFDQVNYQLVQPDDVITLPGAYYQTESGHSSTVDANGLVHFLNQGVAVTAFPANTLHGSLRVEDKNGTALRVYRDVPLTLVAAANPPVCVQSAGQLFYQPTDATMKLKVSYYSAPAQTVYLRIVLSSSSSFETPLFSGLTLLNWFSS